MQKAEGRKQAVGPVGKLPAVFCLLPSAFCFLHSSFSLLPGEEQD